MQRRRELRTNLFAIAACAALLGGPSIAGAAGGLRGSTESMKSQHAIAIERDLQFIADAAQMQALIDGGGLERIESTGIYTLSKVSYPYAVPEVKVFIERLATQYSEANGAPLVVTSLTRPTSLQPRNAHELSVHPAGMAVDFRVPQDAKARKWLEDVLLQLENAGVLDVTREKNPPHYHVAVFPQAYAAYVEKAKAFEAVAAVLPKPVITESVNSPARLVQAASIPVSQNSASFNGLMLTVMLMSGVLITVLLVRSGLADGVLLT